MKFKVGDRVTCDEYGEEYPATIIRLTKANARLEFDDEETQTVPLRQLTAYSDDVLPMCAWEGHRFSCEVEGHRFHGECRNASAGRVSGYAVDMWGIIDGVHVSVASLGYVRRDPRDDLPSLDEDIFATINATIFELREIEAPTVSVLAERAARPKVKVTSLEALDAIILELKDVRATALRSGGQRLGTIRGEGEGSPEVMIQIDLTKQAMVLEGKVPPIGDNMADTVTGRGSGELRRKRGKASNENIQTLLDMLDTVTDKAERRRIRATLRKLGHKGGTRQKKVTKSKPVEAQPTTTKRRKKAK